MFSPNFGINLAKRDCKYQYFMLKRWWRRGIRLWVSFSNEGEPSRIKKHQRSCEQQKPAVYWGQHTYALLSWKPLIEWRLQVSLFQSWRRWAPPLQFCDKAAYFPEPGEQGRRNHPRWEPHLASKAQAATDASDVAEFNTNRPLQPEASLQLRLRGGDWQGSLWQSLPGLS